MYCATCGTSSTRSRRVWSLDAIATECTKPSVLGRPGRPAAVVRSALASGSPRASPARRDDDRPLAARPERLQVVVAGERLDLEARVLGEVARARPRTTSRSASRRTQRAAGCALAALLEDRREVDDPARRVVLGGGDLRDARGRSRDRRGRTRGQPAVEAGEVVGVGQPDVDDGEAARARGGRPASRTPRAGRSRVASRKSEFRAMNASANGAGGRAGRRSSRSASTSVEPAARRGPAASARRRGRARASPDRCRRP